MFVLHINNHKNRKSFNKMTSSEKKKAKHSYTVCALIENGVMHFGVSVCSREDNFCKATGITRAQSSLKDSNFTAKVPEYIKLNNMFGKYFVIKAKKLIDKL